MSINNIDKKITDLFVQISNQGKTTRLVSLLLLLILLIVGIYGSINISIFMLLLPVIGVPLMRRFTNPLHDKNIKKYVAKNKYVIGVDLAQNVLSLSKEKKLHYCKEALLIEIRSKLQKKS